MNWIIIGLLVTGIITFLAVWLRTSHAADLGSVSHQWINEHRLDSSEHSRR